MAIITYPVSVTNAQTWVWSIAGGPANGSWYATTNAPSYPRIPASGSLALDANGVAIYVDGNITNVGTWKVNWFFSDGQIADKTIVVTTPSRAGIFPKVAGDTISAADYNAIQSSVSATKTTFIGVACVSSQVTSGSQLTAAHWNNLKTDIDYCVTYNSLSVTTIPTRVTDSHISAADANLYYTNASTANSGKRWKISLTIAANAQNWQLTSYLAAAGYTGSRVGLSDITVTINAGVYVGATSTGVYALYLNGTAAGDRITLINNGTIIGAGGNGGQASAYGGGYINSPTAGGPALYVPVAATVQNNGALYGGGGGGGQGGWGILSITIYLGTTNSYASSGGGGGGGAGYNPGAGGAGGTGGTYNGRAGAAGTTLAGGAGGAGGGGTGTAGGKGGDPGQAGTGGTAAGSYYINPGAAAGNYVVGNANVTWTATGTRAGNVA